jgi:hypothetical protein
MVANDPHLPLQYPPLFHLAAMTASDGSGLNVVGGAFAGIPGALIAVPLAATGNAVAQHLAANTRPGDDPEEELERDYDADGERPPDVVTDDEGAPVEPEERDPGYGNRRGTDPSAPPSDPPEEGNP